MRTPLIQQQKTYPITHPDFRIPVLVNRTRVIATAEDKANITGFKWTRPRSIPKGFVERRNAKGEFLDYTLTLPVTIKDVDGREKHTVKTSYFEADKRTSKEKPSTALGIWVDGLAGKYHGRKSRNWIQEQLTLASVIDELNNGFAIAPGFFTQPEGESFRSGDYIQHRQIILLDGDEWTAEHPAPRDLDNFKDRYPTLVDDFYWIGESISSRTQLKPEFRSRLMAVLPEPIYKGDFELWQTCIDSICTKYPFVARGVGIDKVRLSFGNARPECENRVLGGIVSHETFTQWQAIASEKQAKAEALRVESEKQKAEREARRAEKNAITTELKRRGHAIAENKDPLREFCEVNPERLLIDLGLASRLSGNTWNWYESSQGRSFELENGIIKPFSGTMQGSHPEADSTKPVNAHRFILYHLHHLDITQDSDKRPLRCILADLGYGTHTDDYKKAKRTEKLTGVREGLVSPLDLRRAEPPLPTENTERVMRTLDENAPEIQKAFSQKARVVGLRGGTGDGKTESVIIEAKEGRRVAMTEPSLPVAEQVHDRVLGANCGSQLWHSDFYGYKDEINEANITPDAPFEDRVRAFHKGDILCVKPLLRKASQQRGIPAAIGACPECPMQADCRKIGYLSQIPAAQRTQVLTIAMPKLFIDPAFTGFYRQLAKRQPKDRLHVIDEAKAHEMFIDCSLSKELLQQWVQDWQGEKLGIFAEAVLHLLEVKTEAAYEIARTVSKLDEKDITLMARQASRFRISYTRVRDSKTDPITGNALAYHAVQFENGQIVFIAFDFDAYKRLRELDIPAMQPTEIEDAGYLTLTPSQAFRFGIFDNETPDDFTEIPKLYENQKWTCFQQLKAFAERYPRSEDAPIWYHAGVLHWVNAPVLHKRVKHLVCMSATLQCEGFERAFDSEKVTFIETPPTYWVDGHRAFQVRTGAYPRRSLLEYTPDWSEVIGLSKTGQYFVDLIEMEIERDREVKHVIITVNAIVNMKRDELINKHSNLIDVHSFHKMEGLDYTQEGIVFWILGCPNVALDVVRQQAKVIYGNDTQPLNYDYDKETGTFIDERLQRCWVSLVSALLTQAAGRARLNRLANTVIMFSNVLIPDFTGRATGFVPQDIEVAAGLDNLAEVAQFRMEAESKAEKPHKETRKEREAKRSENRETKEQQKQQVYRLYNAGVPPDEINKRTGVNRRTIFRWMQAYDF